MQAFYLKKEDAIEKVYWSVNVSALVMEIIYGKRCKTSLEYLNTQRETMQNGSSWDQTLCIVFLGETIASVTDTFISAHFSGLGLCKPTKLTGFTSKCIFLSAPWHSFPFSKVAHFHIAGIFHSAIYLSTCESLREKNMF